jgi:hypothetical protein
MRCLYTPAKVPNLRKIPSGVDGNHDLLYDTRMVDADLDKHLVREYRERWQAVEAVDAAERQLSPVAWRWQQLNAIYRLAKGLQLTEVNWSEQEMAGYERWSLLKRRMG